MGRKERLGAERREELRARKRGEGLQEDGERRKGARE